MPARLGQLALPNLRVTQQDAADLRRFLIGVPDPRGMRGRRFPMLPLLCAATAAVLTGARSLIAIGEWIAEAPQSVLRVLGFPADPLTGVRTVPHTATVRRLLQRVDGDALDAATSEASRSGPTANARTTWPCWHLPAPQIADKGQTWPSRRNGHRPRPLCAHPTHHLRPPLLIDASSSSETFTQGNSRTKAPVCDQCASGPPRYAGPDGPVSRAGRPCP